MKLSEWRPGTQGTITAVDGDGPVVRRLMEMGLIEGCGIRMVRAAPFGDPIEVSIDGCLLTLRRAEAEHLEVESCCPASS